MRRLRSCLFGLLPLLLSACLEVEQHPPWSEGAYDNKPDNRVQQVHFHNDRLAWNAAISNRNQLQNEYNRTEPYGQTGWEAAITYSRQLQGAYSRTDPYGR